MRLQAIVLLSLLASVTVVVPGVMPRKAAAEPSTIVYADPMFVIADEVDQSYTVNLLISDVVDLYAWQVGITFDPDILEFTGFFEGTFLKQLNKTTLLLEHIKDFNTLGIVYFRGCCILGPSVGVDENGQLAYATFRSVGIGVSSFHLTDVVFIDSALGDIEAEVTEDFPVRAYSLSYNIGISSNVSGASGPPNPPVLGMFNHEFSWQYKKLSFDILSVNAWYCKVTIPKALLWCTGFEEWRVNVDGALATHTAAENATRTTLLFEKSAGNTNVEIVGSEVADYPCDLNKDRCVDIFDLVLIAGAYGSTLEDSRWLPEADLVAPWGTVNLYDLLAVCSHYGERF